MNTKYMKLTNGNIIVTDENGYITERKDNIDKDLLILENKIEIVNNETIKIDDEITKEEYHKRTNKAMLIGIPTVLICFNAIFFIVGGLAGDGSFIEAGCQAISSIGMGEALTLSVLIPYFSLVLPISNKKIKKLERKMKKANELCKQYEKELEKVKEEIKEENVTIEPISLVHENLIEQREIEEELQIAYSPKKRVLSK